jgi:hypothetical protein
MLSIWIRRYKCDYYAACPLKPHCTKAKGNRRHAKENLLSEQGIALRQQRCIEPESTFGDLKPQYGLSKIPPTRL